MRRPRSVGWRRFAGAVLAAMLVAPALAQERADPPPAWLVRGFEAAFLDGSTGAAHTATGFRRHGQSIAALAQAGGAGRVAARAVDLLASADPAAREAGWRTLRPEVAAELDDAALNRLLALFESADPAIRRAAMGRAPAFPDAARTLAAIDLTLPLIGSDNAEDNAGAMEVLALAIEAGPSDVALSYLLPRARGGEHHVLLVLLDILSIDSVRARLSPGREAEIVALARAALEEDAMRDAAAGFLAARAGDMAPRLGRGWGTVQHLLASADAQHRAIGLSIALNPPEEIGAAEIELVLPFLGSAEPMLRSMAAVMLAAAPSARRAGDLLPALRPALTDPAPEVREAALLALSTDVAPEDAEGLIAVLLALTEDAGYASRESAARAAASLARNGAMPTFLTRIVPLLAHADRGLRIGALRAIRTAEPGPAGAATIGAILPLLSDPHWAVRETAAQTLAVIPSPTMAGTVVDHLLPLLRDGDMRARWAASRALSLLPLEDRAAAVTDTVLASQPDVDEQPRRWKAAIIGHAARGALGPPTARRLQAMMTEADPVTRIFAAQALATMAEADIAATDPAAVLALLPLRGVQPWHLHTDAVRAALRLLARLPIADRMAAMVAGPLMAILLGPTGSDDQDAAMALVERWGPAPPAVAIAALASPPVLHGARSGGGRAVALIATGAHPDVVTLLAWIGHPAVLPLATGIVLPDAAGGVLTAFETYWTGIAASDVLRAEAVEAVISLTTAACGAAPTAGCWSPAHEATLRRLVERMRASAPSAAGLLDAILPP